MKASKGRYVFIFLSILGLSIGFPKAEVQGKVDKHTVAAWLFNEGKGEVVKDVSENGHDGKFAGKPKWVNAKFGTGLEFPGDASGYVVVDSTEKLKLKELSIEVLVKVKKPTGKWQGIICKQQAGCTNRNYGIWVHIDQNVLRAEIGSGGDCAFNMQGTAIIADDKWHYLAFTYDSKLGRVYVDGKLEADKPQGQEPFQSNDPLTIGVPDLNNANGLLGVIDEARISNVARTEAEIKEAMSLGLAMLLGVEAAGKLTVIWGKIKKEKR